MPMNGKILNTTITYKDEVCKVWEACTFDRYSQDWRYVNVSCKVMFL